MRSHSDLPQGPIPLASTKYFLNKPPLKVVSQPGIHHHVCAKNYTPYGTFLLCQEVTKNVIFLPESIQLETFAR